MAVEFCNLDLITLLYNLYLIPFVLSLFRDYAPCFTLQNRQCASQEPCRHSLLAVEYYVWPEGRPLIFSPKSSKYKNSCAQLGLVWDENTVWFYLAWWNCSWVFSPVQQNWHCISLWLLLQCPAFAIILGCFLSKSWAIPTFVLSCIKHCISENSGEGGREYVMRKELRTEPNWHSQSLYSTLFAIIC